MTTHELLQSPPHSEDAEMATLGAMLLDAEALVTCRRVVGPDDFFKPAHRTLCAALFAWKGTESPDLVFWGEHLRQTGNLEAMGGLDYVYALVDGVPSVASAEHYASIVKAKAELRGIIAACHDAASAAFDPGADPADVSKTLQGAVYDLCRRREGQDVHTFGRAADEALERARQVQQGEAQPGVPTGFRRIDGALGGMERGGLYTLAGDTSSGKTALACNIATNVAESTGPVLFVSREMSAAELGKRLVQSRSGVSGQSIRFGFISEDDWTRLHMAAGELANMPGAIDCRSRTVAEIGLSARMLSAKLGKPLALVVVDYLQLMDYESGRSRGESTAHAVGRFAWGLKDLAMDLQCPVLLLSQLNRESVKASGPPTKHSLKQSGDIENHSNGIVLLHRPADVIPDGAGRVAIWVQAAKARDGMVSPWEGDGQIRLWWTPSCTRFDPAQRDTEVEA